MTTVQQNDAADIIAGRHPDPFSVLGLHHVGGKLTICAFLPGAETVEVIEQKTDRKIADLSPVENA